MNFTIVLFTVVCCLAVAGACPAQVEPTAAGVSFSDHHANVLDFWAAPRSDGGQTAVVVWWQGEAGGRPDRPPQYLMDAGISYIAANYRERDESTIQDAVRDGARITQFIRHKSDAWHIDPNRIILMGGSWSGGISLWAAVHDDIADPAAADPVARQSSRPAAAIAFGTQATYDVDDWQIHAYPLNPDDPKGRPADAHEFYGLESNAQLDEPIGQAIRADVDTIDLMDANDSPLLLFNDVSDAGPSEEGFDVLHHPKHTIALKERADAVGLDATAYVATHPDPTWRLPEGMSNEQAILKFLRDRRIHVANP
jgi:hypothetical protein